MEDEDASDDETSPSKVGTNEFTKKTPAAPASPTKKVAAPKAAVKAAPAKGEKKAAKALVQKKHKKHVKTHKEDTDLLQTQEHTETDEAAYEILL